jgi:hypothetical protein
VAIPAFQRLDLIADVGNSTFKEVHSPLALFLKLEINNNCPLEAVQCSIFSITLPGQGAFHLLL